MAHNRLIPHGTTAVVLIALSMVAMAADTALPTAVSNLNGARYRIANMPQLGTNISLLARSGGLYFDVYTPLISSLYSQVQWSTHPVPFPQDFVKAFEGSSTRMFGSQGSFHISVNRSVDVP